MLKVIDLMKKTNEIYQLELGVSILSALIYISSVDLLELLYSNLLVLILGASQEDLYLFFAHLAQKT